MLHCLDPDSIFATIMLETDKVQSSFEQAAQPPVDLARSSAWYGWQAEKAAKEWINLLLLTIPMVF